MLQNSRTLQFFIDIPKHSRKFDFLQKKLKIFSKNFKFLQEPGRAEENFSVGPARPGPARNFPTLIFVRYF